MENKNLDEAEKPALDKTAVRRWYGLIIGN